MPTTSQWTTTVAPAIYYSSGNVGIGTSTPQSLLDVKYASTINNTYTLGSFALTPTITSSGAYSYTGILAGVNQVTISNGVSNTGSVIGLQSGATTNIPGTGSLASLYGEKISYGTYTGSSGTVTNAYGLYISPYHQGGTITNSYGLVIASPATGGTATNQFGIYQSGSGMSNYLAGSLGVGTVSPRTTLEVTGGIRALPGTPANDSANVGYAFGANGDTGMFLVNNTGAADGDLAFYSNASPKMTVLSGGNVGIGTASPGAKLQIKQSANAVGGGIQVLRSDAANNADFYVGNDNQAYIQAGNSGYITIQTGGNVGIGTVSPGQKLDVSGVIQATNFVYASDRRLKYNIKPIDDALEKVLKLRGVTYNWKASGRADMGLIAQEVEEVFPDMVQTNQSTKMKAVQYGNLVGPIIEAIKDIFNHMMDHEDKTAREIASLKKENAELKNAICEMNPKSRICITDQKD